MSTRYGALAVCTHGRIGIVTGSKTRPAPDTVLKHVTVWFGVMVNGLGKWSSVDPRWLSPAETSFLKDELNLDKWETEE